MVKKKFASTCESGNQSDDGDVKSPHPKRKKIIMWDANEDEVLIINEDYNDDNVV